MKFAQAFLTFIVTFACATYATAQAKLPVGVMITETVILEPETDPPLPPTPPLPPSLPPTAPSVNNIRAVVFVHGLGGNAAGWLPASSALQDTFRIVPLRPSYSLAQTAQIESLASALDEVIPKATGQRKLVELPLTVDPSQTFIVGHSLGGLMGRELWRWRDQTLKEPLSNIAHRGLVTFDTPHGGAPIVGNSLGISHLVSTGCTALTKGPLTEKAASFKGSGLLTFFGMDLTKMIASAADSLCGGKLLDSLVAQIGYNSFKPVAGPGINKNSFFITRLNAYTDPYNFPKLNITSYEEQPVTLRLIASTKTTSAGRWQANDDTKAIDSLNSSVFKYKKSAADLRSEADKTDNLRWYQPLGGIIPALDWAARQKKAASMRQSASYYEAAVPWLQNLNTQWQNLIGASVRRERIGEIYACSCTESNDIEPYMPTARGCADQSSQRTGSCKGTFFDYAYRDYREENDGAVPISSQQAWLRPDGTPVPRVLYTNSNHFQIRNDRNTRDAFHNHIFKQTFRNDNWFATDKR